MPHLDGVAVGEDDGALDAVLQLAHVARPAVGAQPLDGLGRDGEQRLLHVAAESLHEIVRERHHVVLALAQRRHRDREHREAEEQVFAEGPGRDRGLEVLVRRGDQAHVDVHEGRPAEPLEAPLLERAQHLRLQAQRQVADLVQEQGAPVRHLELADLAARRAGECAFLVPEQLGLEQGFGDGRAVDGHHRARRPLAERVQRAREQLLAGAALAFDEHRGVGRRGAVQRCQHPDQRRVRPDDLRRAAPHRQLLLQEEVLGQQPPLLERARDQEQEVVRIDRLGQKVEGAFLHRGHGVLDATVGGHHDDGRCGVLLLGGPQHAEPVPARQPEVRQHDRRRRLGEQPDGLRLVAGLGHGVPLTLQGVPQHRAERVLVLDDQDEGGCRQDGNGRSGRATTAPSQEAHPPCGPRPGCP